MAEATIPVDLRSPGQVFGCLGLMEAAEVLCGPATGSYAWVEGSTRARFTLSIDGRADPVERAIRFLTQARAQSLTFEPVEDRETRLTAARWDVETVLFDAADMTMFPFKPPSSPATLPLRLVSGDDVLTVGHWGDEPFGIGRENAKFWAGSGGYPGAALARDALKLLHDLDAAALAQIIADPFGFAAPQSSSFSFDWRRSYVPLDAGFSPNEHGDRIRMVGYPLVELLAVIGLQNARPERVSRDNRLAYRYALSSAKLPTMLARAVLGGASLGFAVRRFRMQLGWPGQEGQARCIIDSREEQS